MTAIVLVLMYGYTTWTTPKYLVKKKLDGNYSRILCVILNKTWKQHPKNKIFTTKDFSTTHQARFDTRSFQFKKSCKN